MNVLFKNIPIGISASEVIKLIESVFNDDWIDSKGIHISLSPVEMLEIQDAFTRPIEQFGLVRISPPEAAKKIIKDLDGSFFKKNKITVRQYYNRSASNDPRVENSDSSKIFVDNRENDRRAQDKFVKERRIKENRKDDRRKNPRNEKERREKDRREKDRRKHSLIYSRLI